jgi:hypothetical protein
MRTWQCKYLLGTSEERIDLDVQTACEAFAGAVGIECRHNCNSSHVTQSAK